MRRRTRVVGGWALAVATCSGLIACSSTGTPAVDAGTAGRSGTAQPTPAARSTDSTDPTTSSDPAARTKAELDRVAKPDEPGCTAAVGRRGKVIWTGTTGLADVASQRPLTPDTLIRIASVSKQFTATAVLLLQQRGELALSDRLSEHLDGLPTWSERVTIGQLMHMTSGIPEVLNGTAIPWSDVPTASRRAIRAAIRTKLPRLDFAPGERWAYSNSNYYLLADVVERRSRMAFDDFVRREILRPLDLTMLAETDAPGPAEASSYRYDPVNTPEPDVWEIDATGAGGLRATPSTLVRWADNYRTGRLGGRELSREQLRGAVSTTLGTSNPSPSEVYGAGIIKLSDDRLVHGGQYAGFRTSFVISADRGTAIAVACNLRDIDVERLGGTIAEFWT